MSPQIEGKLLYLRTADGVERTVRASADIPSLTAAVGAAPTLLAGAWTDDSLDRRWRAPTAAELRHDIDHFHLPPAEATGDPSWAEWHYFNVITPDRRQWAFITYMLAGAVGDSAGQWGGQLLVTLHEQGRPARRFTSTVPARDVRFSTTDADLRIGEARVDVLDDGRYALRGTAREDGTGTPVTVDLVVAPAEGAYFPGASLTSGIVSGYVVAGLRADATGSICVGGAARATTARRRTTITTGASGAASPGSGARRARATTPSSTAAWSPRTARRPRHRSSSISSIGRDSSRSSARATSATWTGARRASAA